MGELKACPFCGSAAMLYRGTINCTDEECAVAYSDDTDELITDLWNTRPIEDALRRERDEAQDRVHVILKSQESERSYYKRELDEARDEAERLREELKITRHDDKCAFDMLREEVELLRELEVDVREKEEMAQRDRLCAGKCRAASLLRDLDALRQRKGE